MTQQEEYNKLLARADVQSWVVRTQDLTSGVFEVADIFGDYSGTLTIHDDMSATFTGDWFGEISIAASVMINWRK